MKCPSVKEIKNEKHHVIHSAPLSAAGNQTFIQKLKVRESILWKDEKLKSWGGL